ncbi:MAG: Peptidoglycan/LPS O-acetylase OafA/YrhL, contains acyltransferase and SGNH-hydrolase domain [Betaproteobacteria bacterium]|nr:Peptidoglycan/LPS O-acetylase OafA/YrhL, contains acyltransferase and SGNH-hydrolase domain [Betaproteobacteria bacterium]
MQAHSGTLKYRSDIDGLRAIAVLAVVGFHAFPGWVGGGFIGVDVFFVISGFLIGGIIWNQLEQGNFNLGAFYTRRIARIFPALAVVLVASLLFGLLVLLPIEYMALGRHVAGGAAFVSNLLSWSEAGYFDHAAQTKPLLHLWSLGIEEQFYVVWPLLMLWLWRGRRPFLAITGALALVSFLINIATVGSHGNAAFYSPLSRLWELAAGAILSYLATHGPEFSARSREWRSPAGLGLILAGALLLKQDFLFPGGWALLPVAGAWLVISAGPGAWLNRQLLGHPALVWVGLISYPLYLWHWPTLAFARIVNGSTPGWEVRSALVLLSFVLAWLTCKLVERPLRFEVLAKAGTRISLCALLATCGGAGYAVSSSWNMAAAPIDFADHLNVGLLDRARTRYAGNPGRGAAKFSLSPCPDTLAHAAFAPHFCLKSAQGAPTVALFGDSHADDKYVGIAEQDRAHAWLLAANSSCPPVNGIDFVGDAADCRQRTEGITRWLIARPEIRTVVLSFWGNYTLEPYAADHRAAAKAGRGAGRISGPGDATLSQQGLFLLGLENTVDLLQRNGKSVVLLIDVPELPFFPADCLRRSGADSCKLSRQEVLARQAPLRAMMKQIQLKYPQARVYDSLAFFCAKAQCELPDDTMSYYNDSHHLSPFGSDYYATGFLHWLYGGEHDSRP